MENQLVVVLVAAAVVIAGTFVLKKLMGNFLKLVGLAGVAFLGRRAAMGANGYNWMEGQDFTVIIGSAIFGLLVGAILNGLIFKEDGFGRHFFGPLIAVAFTYAAALMTRL